MKIAIILHGNLRTFFMPLREDSGIRICDRIYTNIVKHNHADLFLVTDTTDFYYNGIHYLDSSQKDEVRNPTSTMFHTNVDFIDSKVAEELLVIELNEFFKEIKALEIQPLTDLSQDPKFILLSTADALRRPDGRVAGSIPERIVAQYKKIKSGYALLQEYERKNNFSYDLIFRARFDGFCGPDPIDLSSFNYEKSDVFISGMPDAPIIYDWSAFGTRQAMGLALNLYDHLGFTLVERLYRCECLRCGLVRCGVKMICGCNAGMDYDEMTLSSEHHLYKLFNDNKIRYSYSGCPMVPYRYR